MNAGTAEILVKCDFNGEKVIENLRRECKRVLRFLEDEKAYQNIRNGWFGAYGASSLHDLRYAIEAVIAVHTKDRKDLDEACKAIEFKEKAMALYTAIKAASLVDKEKR